MENNLYIKLSRRVYARLLTLYPQKHRLEYGADMLQVFTDQCRSIKRARSGWGFILLWMHTLIDLGINVTREHLTSPHSSLGWLEAVPNAPLPWKGVALVLLPGVIFFVAQIALQTGELDWYSLLFYWGAYFMIIPVLVVWIWKRKLPIWGLIPLGLLCNTLLFVLTHLAYFYNQITTLYGSNPVLRWLVTVANGFPLPTLEFIVAIALLVVILALLGSAKRRVGIPRAAWVCLGIFVLLVTLNILTAGQNCITWNCISLALSEPIIDHFWLVYYNFCHYGGFLALILFGALLARRHGRLAALLPLGYLLPTVISGPVTLAWSSRPDAPEFAIMLWSSVTALVYRFLVTLAAPLWIVRSASGQMQKRASWISLMVMLAVKAVFDLRWLFSSIWGVDQQYWLYFSISDQLIISAGIALALLLYRKDPALQTTQKEEKPISDRYSNTPTASLAGAARRSSTKTRI